MESIENLQDKYCKYIKCNKCKNKIKIFHKKTYYAFDKQYCYCCWVIIKKKYFSEADYI
jgi:hypothetical protein